MKKIAKKGLEVNPLEVDPETPLGEKKKLATEIEQNYNPNTVEKSYAIDYWSSVVTKCASLPSHHC